MSAPIDLNRLTAFVVVAQTASFTTAAEKLRLPRSSVSRQIAALERELGTALFNRTTRHVALSTAGEALFERVGPQLEQIRTAVGALSDREQEPTGELRITAAPGAATYLLPEVLAGFCVRYPGINVDLRLTESMVDLVAEGIDVALRATVGRLADSSLVARKLVQADIGLYAAPAYLARRGSPKSLDDLASHDRIVHRYAPPPPPLRNLMRPSRIVADDMTFILAATCAGLGIGALATQMAKPEVDAGRLVRLLPRVSLGKGALYFVHPRTQALPKKVAAFRDYLIEYLAAHPV